MDPFCVEQVPKHLLKQMVEKFKTGAEGGAFYRCNKNSKYFVEKVKPIWPLPGSSIWYYRQDKRVVEGIKVVKEGNGLSNPPLEYCKVEDVQMGFNSVVYYKGVILPEVKVIGAIERLSLNTRLPEEDARELLEAAKPDVLEINDRTYDATAAVFDGIQHLEVEIEVDSLAGQGSTMKIFHLAQNRKILSFWLYCSRFPENVLKNFIEEWLRGRPTGTLEKLIFQIRADEFTTEHVNVLLEHNLMIRCEQTATGYIIEGQRGSLQMDVEIKDDEDDYGRIEFTFL